MQGDAEETPVAAAAAAAAARPPVAQGNGEIPRPQLEKEPSHESSEVDDALGRVQGHHAI